MGGAVPNRKRWRKGNKSKLFTVPSATPASSPAVPYLQPPQIDAISLSIPDPFRIPCCTPFLKWLLSCFSPIYPSRLTHSHLFVTFHFHPSQPGYSHRTGFAFRLTKHGGCILKPKQKWALVLPHWSRLHLVASWPGSSLHPVVSAEG